MRQLEKKNFIGRHPLYDRVPGLAPKFYSKKRVMRKNEFVPYWEVAPADPVLTRVSKLRAKKGEVINHQFIDQYPISLDSQKLVLGSIHPVAPVPGELFFFGNDNNLWKNLNEAFPDELNEPIGQEDIMRFLGKRKIAISDIIVQCIRVYSSQDKDMVPTVMNTDLLARLRESEITEILFTGGFGVNSPFRIFYETLLGQKLTYSVRTNRGLTLNKSFFGREVKLSILYSASGNANVGIARSKQFQAVRDTLGNYLPVRQFRIKYYQEKFALTQME